MSIPETPAYLHNLGLTAAPFTGAPSRVAYFNAGSRRKTLDMTLYLSRYSDLVLLVHGPTGSGKSTLMHEISARAGANIHVIGVNGDSTIDAYAICDAILDSFSLLTPQLSNDERYAQIKEQLEHLQRKGYHTILCIDNAEQLAADAFQLVEFFSDLRGEAGRNPINVVLFTPQPDKIALRGPSVRHRIKRIEIPALEADETPAYIRHRLASVARDGSDAIYDQVFDARTVKRIARESHGWPGGINALAQQRLVRFAARSHPGSAPLDHRLLSKKQFVMIATLVAALIAVFALQDDVNYLVSKYLPVIMKNDARPQAPSPTPTLSTPIISEKLAPIAALPPVATVVEPEIAPIELPTTGETAETEVDADDVAVPPVEIQTAASPEPTSPKRPQPTAVKSKVQGDRWLLAHNPDQFTLQVSGSSQKGDVQRTIRKYKFSEPTAVYTTIKKDKPWFGLVTGIYPDLASAQQARAALPEELIRGTWVRRIRAVQSEINKSLNAEKAAVSGGAN